jgi:hypothetical protein
MSSSQRDQGASNPPRRSSLTSTTRRNGSGIVSVQDLLKLLKAWGPCT